MKKVILGTMLIVMSLLMISCEKKVKNEFNCQDSETLEILKNFNDSLSLNSNHETKGFLRFIAVASADVVGAYELGRIGVKIGAIGGLKGALIGGAIGGIVGGVGASYVAYCGTRPETTSSLDSPTIDMVVAGYSRIIVSDSLMQSYVVGEINLNFPEKFNDDAIRTGKMHNLILDISLNGGELSNVKTVLSDMEKSVIYSDEYMDNYNEVVDKFRDMRNTDDMEYLYKDGTVESSVMRLFLEIYNRYPNNCEDVNFIINKYIDVVDKSKEMPDEMKSCIYNGLAVAAYSYKYWQDNNM